MPTASATGASITAASSGNNYVFKQWEAVTPAGTSFASSSSASTTLNGNPTGNVTIKAVYRKPITVTYKANGQNFSTQTYGYGSTLAFPASNPDGATYSCSGKTFVGWVAEANKDYSHASNAPTYATAGGSVTAAATYYAVFATQSGGSEATTTFDFNGSIFGSSTYVSTDFEWQGMDFKRSNMYYNNSGAQIKASSNGFWNVEAFPGAIKQIKVTATQNNATLYVGATAKATTSSNTISTGAERTIDVDVNNNYRYIYIKSGSNYTVITTLKVTYSTISYSNYATTCCQPLAQINGSVSFTNVSPTSVTVGVPSDYSDKDNANLEGYIFKRYAASTGGDALETIETDAANKTMATFNTGLVANTTYYYTIIAKHSSSSCNSVETSPRKSYKIVSYVVSYANGGGSGTNPGAHDPVLANGKVTLKSNTFDAPTGKEFRVWNDGTSDLDEGEEYTVTANTVMTAQWQCMEPGFTKNLSTTQVNYLQGETAAKLSVTAAANGAELSYAWEMSANGTTGWSSVGTNSNEYTPSTATAGDQYYHCIVTNLADGCTESKATSAVAHIHVDVPAACLEPVISVASDTYYEDKSVTITCGTDGAVIYYTTDGSTTPTSGSTLYEGAITVDHSMTIKAIAIKAGMDNSTVAEATYTIKCETPTIVLAAGNYTGVQTTTITKGYGTKIYYTTDGTTPSNTNGTEYTGAVSIDQPMTLKAIVWKDGCTNSEVASAAYTLKCTTPEFNKGTDTYTGAQSITLSGTAGADIYYTLDGTTPSKTNGTKYTAAIEVSANQTVKAIAVKEGWGDSEIASATYTIQYNVYWWVNGVAWTEKGGSTLVTYGQTATAPTTAPTKANGCGDKFMGWTETQNYENDNTAPMDMFTETSAAITGETNFYAVFADYGEEE